MTLTDYIARRSTRPAAPVQDSAPAPAAAAHPDAVYLQAWGLTPLQWAAMDHPARVWHRWNFNTAPHFSTMTRA